MHPTAFLLSASMLLLALLANPIPQQDEYKPPPNIGDCLGGENCFGAETYAQVDVPPHKRDVQVNHQPQVKYIPPPDNGDCLGGENCFSAADFAQVEVPPHKRNDGASSTTSAESI